MCIFREISKCIRTQDRGHFHRISCVLISYYIDFINHITRYRDESILVISTHAILIKFASKCYVSATKK